MRYQRNLMIVVTSVAIGCTVAIAVSIQKVRERNELAQQVKETTLKAQTGDQGSEVALSRVYYYGNGLPQSYSEAFLWSSKAAAQGNAQAEYDLGILYERGRGVPQDLPEAFQWYQRAAIKGHAWAEESLGSLYYQGRGVGKDPAQAVSWYRKAADNGVARAQYFLGYIFQYGLVGQKDDVDAKAWYEKASAQGDESAERALGLRGNGLGSREVVIITAIAFAWVWVASHFASSKRTAQRVKPIAPVVCGLAYVAMRIFGAYFGFRSFRAFDSFQLIENGAAGLAMGMSVYFFASVAKTTKLEKEELPC
jgi:TPR repeat protein